MTYTYITLRVIISLSVMSLSVNHLVSCHLVLMSLIGFLAAAKQSGLYSETILKYRLYVLIRHVFEFLYVIRYLPHIF